MPEPRPQFADLERLLCQAGIKDRCSRRLLEELQDHYVDLFAEQRALGASSLQAGERALGALGRPADIVAAAAQYRDLLRFSYRHPLLASVTRGILSVAAAPAMPIHYCAQRGEVIARWGASVSLAGLLTAALLLSMQTMLGTF